MNERLVVKLFGPAKELDITFKKVTLFIGNQGTGKICVAKLFSMFIWLGKVLSQKKYKRLLLVISILFCSFPIVGKDCSYIPSVGEKIIFYPVTTLVDLNGIKGYDCFFDGDKAINKIGKYNFNPKYILSIDKNGVTPFTEIEGKEFLVESSETKTIQKCAYYIFVLRRTDDDKKVVLRVPLIVRNDILSLTDTWIKTYELGYDEYMCLDIPFVNSDSLRMIQQKFVNQDVAYYGNRSNSVAMNNLFYETVDAYNPNLSNRYDIRHVFCYDIDFYDALPGNYYKQLCSKCFGRKGQELYLPVLYAKGNEYKLYNYICDQVLLFPSMFIYEEDYKRKKFQTYRIADDVQLFTDQLVYYGINPSLEKLRNVQRIDNRKDYRLNYSGLYLCEGFEFYEEKGFNFSSDTPFAVLKDSSNCEFIVPAKLFSQYFMLKQDGDSILALKKADQLKQKELKQEQHKRISVKYGKNIADRLELFDDKSIERFEQLVTKYGKNNAILMIEGRTRIGWTKEMCIESWGNPTRINSTETAHGVYEQWVYDYSYDYEVNLFFLYFENGHLVAIN